MITTDNITAMLQQHLPAELHPAIPTLAQFLADASHSAAPNGTTTGALAKVQAALQACLTSDPNLTTALHALAGREVNVPNGDTGASVISFGTGTQIGDVSIGDVAGRNVVKIHLDVHQTIGTQQRINAQAGANIGRVIGVQMINYNAVLTRSPQEQRNRRAMLQKVEDAWIKGVLEQSLYHIARIELGMELDLDAVVRPWDVIIQRPEQVDETIPSGQPAIELFEKLGKSMLILGTPGTGKTTVLLELTRDLVACARQDEVMQIPVVFNLSTWSAKREPIATWLKTELQERYTVPSKIATEWIDFQEVIPLLDGLDEVTSDYREECADAINLFRQQGHGLVPLVVCSRVADYKTISKKLSLNGAIVIQPLNRIQVDRFLLKAGSLLEQVRFVLSNDDRIYEFLDTPLMLSIIALTYRGQDLKNVQTLLSIQYHYTVLFDDYIKAMFRRKNGNNDGLIYTPKTVLSWIVWLARQMVMRDLTVYYIERMQPDWLNSLVQKRLVVWGTLLLITFIGFCAGMLLGFVSDLLGMSIGINIVFGYFPVITLAMVTASFVGYDNEIRLVETSRWSWPDLRKELRPIIQYGLAFGMLTGITGLIVISSALGANIGFFLSAIITGATIAFVAPGVMLLKGFSNNVLDIRIRPNEGFWRSLRSSVLIGLMTGCIGGVLGILFVLSTYGMIVDLLSLYPAFNQVDWQKTLFLSVTMAGLYTSLPFTLIFGFQRGGRACLQHILLRLLIGANNYMPFNCVPFLDFCVNRVFLRRVGGGYIFIHRLLMEYFASLTDEDIVRLAGAVDKKRGSSKA